MAEPRPAPAIVTGASGWLGQNLVEALVAEQRPSIRCLVRDEGEGALLELMGSAVHPVIGDVRDPAAIDALMAEAGGATVFHAAGVIHPPDIKAFFDVNVGGTRMVLDGARRAGARRVVHISSNSPFGANERPGDRFDEDSEPNPYLSYGRSKLEGEALVAEAQERGDVETVVLRPPWFYGPNQPARQDQFFAALRKGRFPLVGDGTQQRSMVYTGNLVQGCLLAESVEPAAGRAYWIADAEPYELRAVFDGVREALRLEGLTVTGRIRSIPRAVSSAAAAVDARLQAGGRYVQGAHVLGELRDTIACDISRARTELGYEPTVSLVEGMRASIASCLARGASL